MGKYVQCQRRGKSLLEVNSLLEVAGNSLLEVVAAAFGNSLLAVVVAAGGSSLLEVIVVLFFVDYISPFFIF